MTRLSVSLDPRFEPSRIGIDRLIGVVLFGSVARGTADRRSDIDLIIIVDGNLIHGRRIYTTLARDLDDESFDGNRYDFEILVETPETAVTHSQQLSEIFD
jgi:predicted nucleotidyltransferase